MTEFFLIATGTSPRQMRTVIDELRDLGKKSGFQAWRMDGYDSARWIVLDCVTLVAHVFDQDSRDFYDLELLWGDCPRIDWRAELGLPAEEPAVERELEGVDNSGVSGDADIDEDAELDEPVVMELPDMSTGSNSVEFVEIDPPSKRQQRGRVVYPTRVEEAEDATAEELAMSPVSGDTLGDLDEDEIKEAPRRAAKPKKAAKPKPKTKPKTPAKKPAKAAKAPAKKAKAPAAKKKAAAKPAKPKAAKKKPAAKGKSKK